MTKIAAAAVLTTLALAGCSTLNRADEMALNKAAGIEVRSVDGGVEVKLPEAALFDFGKANLNQNASVVIGRSATLVNRSTKPVRIEGHTDNVGTREYNQKLSEERASVVAQALMTKGVASNRITTRGVAFDRPIGSNDTSEGRAKNRRTEITLVGEKIETLMGPSH